MLNSWLFRYKEAFLAFTDLTADVQCLPPSSKATPETVEEFAQAVHNEAVKQQFPLIDSVSDIIDQCKPQPAVCPSDNQISTKTAHSRQEAAVKTPEENLELEEISPEKLDEIRENSEQIEEQETELTIEKSILQDFLKPC